MMGEFVSTPYRTFYSPYFYCCSSNLVLKDDDLLMTEWFVVGVTVEQFEQAKNRLSHLKTDPGNNVKLKIYALFKQVG